MSGDFKSCLEDCLCLVVFFWATLELLFMHLCMIVLWSPLLSCGVKDYCKKVLIFALEKLWGIGLKCHSYMKHYETVERWVLTSPLWRIISVKIILTNPSFYLKLSNDQKKKKKIKSQPSDSLSLSSPLPYKEDAAASVKSVVWNTIWPVLVWRRTRLVVWLTAQEPRERKKTYEDIALLIYLLDCAVCLFLPFHI